MKPNTRKLLKTVAILSGCVLLLYVTCIRPLSPRAISSGTQRLTELLQADLSVTLPGGKQP